MKKLITILLLLALLLTPTAAMAKVYLVVATLANTGVSSFTFDYHEVEEMDLCLQLVDNAKIGVAQGGDAEASVVIYCTPNKRESDRD